MKPPSQRMLKYLVATPLAILFLVVLLRFLFFSSNIAQSRFSGIKDMFQSRYFGLVINETDHPVRASDYRKITAIPPGKNSLSQDIYDVDSVLIDRPTWIEGKRYTQGLFKYCDFISIRVETLNESEDRWNITPGAWACGLFGKFQYFEDFDSAFPIPRHWLKKPKKPQHEAMDEPPA